MTSFGVGMGWRRERVRGWEGREDRVELWLKRRRGGRRRIVVDGVIILGFLSGGCRLVARFSYLRVCLGFGFVLEGVKIAGDL